MSDKFEKLDLANPPKHGAKCIVPTKDPAGKSIEAVAYWDAQRGAFALTKPGIRKHGARVRGDFYRLAEPEPEPEGEKDKDPKKGK